MAWKLDYNKLRTHYCEFISYFACCDLCGESIKKSHAQSGIVSQRLLCQYCTNDLPAFNQEVIAGNLLNWPAIHQALPHIHFDQLFSVSPYVYPFNHWLAQLKYTGRFEVAQLFSALLCNKWQAMRECNEIAPIDLVISVPLHIKKWQIRGYNQAHLIAKNFSKAQGLPYHPSLMTRVKHNESQMGKTGSQRRKNLSNAFALNEPLANDIKHVLIIDDVVTTGTTASEMSKVLKSAGVENVTLATICLTLPNNKSIK